MSVEQHRKLAVQTLGFGVITVSDSRTEADDTSGDRIAELLGGTGHPLARLARLVRRAWVADDVAAIRKALREMLASSEVDVVVLTGGTGFSPRDVTLEAVTPLFERPIEGFGELFRALSYQEIGAAAMLSRAGAGLVGTRAVFALPGSPKAVELAMEKLILPEAGHLLSQARRG